MLRLVRNYVFWAYERGSIHYDILVTLILLFIFVTPHYFDFGDGPNPNQTSRVMMDGNDAGRLTYKLRASDVDSAAARSSTRTAIEEILRPIAGDISIDDYKVVEGWHGRHVQYIVHAHR
ncbi:MAG: hypothetical protein JSS87_04575 [Acidobacteria bacterium]|nr:hypothetical protein [Acidobacteriota bacterium]